MCVVVGDSLTEVIKGNIARSNKGTIHSELTVDKGFYTIGNCVCV